MKRALTYTLAGAMALAPLTRATADTGSFVAGAAIGGLLGHLATRSYQGRQAQPLIVPPSDSSRVQHNTPGTVAKAPVSRSPSIPASQTGRDVQRALNYFGFSAGGVDGQIGPQTREAISDYQAYMGYPATGELTDFQQDFLFESHERAAATAADPGSEDARRLLRFYMAGVSEPQARPEARPDGQAQLPSFQVSATPDSLAVHCAAVSEKTRANGGYQTLRTMQAPVDVLHEQFCMARTESIATSRALSAKVSDVDEAGIASQCAGFGPVMAPMVTGLATEPRQEIVRQTALVLAESGSDAAQMIDVGEICLGVGYEQDDMAVALGSALVLVALGQGGYGELVGHHLAGGFGTPVAPGQAVTWYDRAMEATRNGQSVFVDNGAEAQERAALVRAAVDQAYDVPPRPQQVSQDASSLPNFSTSD